MSLSFLEIILDFNKTQMFQDVTMTAATSGHDGNTIATIFDVYLHVSLHCQDLCKECIQNPLVTRPSRHSASKFTHTLTN